MITAHDFGKEIGDGFSFSGSTEAILVGVDKLRNAIEERKALVQSVEVKSAMNVDDFIVTELTIKLVEKK